MKILHVNLVYLPAYRYGGPILSIHNLNKWLVKKGASVTVYTTTIDGSDNLDVPIGVPVDIDGVKVFYFPSNFLRGWFYSGALRKFLKKHIQEFDIIHVTAVFTAATPLVRYYAKKYGKPYVLSPRGSLMKEPLAMKKSFLKKMYIFLVEKRNLKDASAIHFTTEAEKDEYVLGGFPMKKFFIIPNGLDLGDYINIPEKGNFRKKWNIGTQKKIILFLSRINWKKGLDSLIPAFSRVRKEMPESVLVIAGGDDEGYGDQIRARVKSLKLEIGKDVIFTGMIVGEDKKDVFSDADMFVLPSYSENLGMAVLEAMHMNLPVLVTRGVGIAPSISKAGAGTVVNKDESEIGEGILRILKSEKEAKKMGDRGKVLVSEEFSMDSIANSFLKEYQLIKRNHEGLIQ